MFLPIYGSTVEYLTKLSSSFLANSPLKSTYHSSRISNGMEKANVTFNKKRSSAIAIRKNLFWFVHHSRSLKTLGLSGTRKWHQINFSFVFFISFSNVQNSCQASHPNFTNGIQALNIFFFQTKNNNIKAHKSLFAYICWLQHFPLLRKFLKRLSNWRLWTW